MLAAAAGPGQVLLNRVLLPLPHLPAVQMLGQRFREGTDPCHTASRRRSWDPEPRLSGPVLSLSHKTLVPLPTPLRSVAGPAHIQLALPPPPRGPAHSGFPSGFPSSDLGIPTALYANALLCPVHWGKSLCPSLSALFAAVHVVERADMRVGGCEFKSSLSTYCCVTSSSLLTSLCFSFLLSTRETRIPPLRGCWGERMGQSLWAKGPGPGIPHR